ncbi:THO complex subunit 4A [Tanacetum coccineum]
MAGASLDMSLDDLIKNNKKSGGGDAGHRGGRGGRGSGPGPTRRFNNRGAHRATPYGGPKGGDVAWRNDMYVDQGIGNVGGRASAMETGTKLYISNLDYGVSNEDIKELFAEVGDLKKYSIHYDRSGRSKGTAEIVYSRKQDALAAVKRYNNVQLDGKPMKIEIVGLNLVAPVPPMANNYTGNMNSFPRGGQARNAGFGRPRGGANGGAARGGAGRGFARGRGRGRGGREEKISADDLDADLENITPDVEASKEHSRLSLNCLEDDGREYRHPLYQSDGVGQRKSDIHKAQMYNQMNRAQTAMEELGANASKVTWCIARALVGYRFVRMVGSSDRPCIPDQIKMRNGKGSSVARNFVNICFKLIAQIIRHRVCLAKVTVAGTEDGAVD